jgi:hypothetical protein
MRYTLTKNEAKILRAINDYGEANFYELVSMAQLTPSECKEAVLLLAKRELVIYNEGEPNLRITKEGQVVRQMLLKSSKSSYLRPDSAVSIISDEEAAAESSFDEMNSEQLDAAFNDEMEKLK